MKKLKRLLVSIVLLAMLITLLITPGQVGAFTSDAQKCATLNLLKGDAGVTDAYLAKTSTRLQSAIISLRLSGLESKALAFKGSATFTDAGKVNWEGGRNILAYLKAHPELGWVGNPDGSFKPNDKIDAQAMHKVLLEVLGYKQGVDFTWGNVISFARSHGFSKTLNASTFTNTNIASAVVEALNQKSKGSDIKFVQALVNSCVVTAAKAIAAGFTVTSVYPIKTNITLTIWERLAPTVAATISNLADTPLYKELEKRTGVKVKYLHPPLGQEDEQFNLMVASKDLPDIIGRGFIGYPGGPEKAIEDGIIIELNKIIDSYAPNLKKYYAQYPDHEKQVKTDTGHHYTFPFIRRDDSLLTYVGLQIRKDWLDELGLTVPTTINEWETVLRAFKNNKNLKAPLTFLNNNLFTDSNAFIGAYGVGRLFYQENGKVKYGPVEQGYRDFIVTFSKWYSEGLLDPDFAAQNNNTLNAKITGEKAGAFINSVGGGMGTYLSSMKNVNPKFALVGVPYPTLKKGETPKFGQKDFNYTPGGSYSITPKCKEVEIAARWLDYAYGEEGHILFNFGIEGESFNWVNGYPKYTEYITNNPDKLPMNQAMARYIRASSFGPIIQDGRYFEQYQTFPVQVEAVKIWSKHEDFRRIPPVTATPGESKIFSAIMNEVKTYTDEMFLKFVMGQEPLSSFDQYVQNVKKMKINEAINMRQAALDRYNNR